MLAHTYHFVPNEPDDLHCYQSALRMVWEALFGTRIGREDAERITNFKSGMQTWPFAGMLALADAGASVVNVEDFDPDLFIADPAAEIRRQSHGDEDVVQHILKVSDAGAEAELVRRCLDHPRIKFEQRRPSLPDLEQAVSTPATAVICNVNYRALVGREGYNGHFVLVDAVEGGRLRIQDPGLPPLRDHIVNEKTFLSAWGTEDDGLPNMIVCSTETDR